MHLRRKACELKLCMCAPQLYTTTGTLPVQPLYAVPTSKSVQRREMAEAGHRKTRAPRKPTPFNFFIKVRARWRSVLHRLIATT